MIVFSSLQQALKEGFVWIEFQPQSGLHVVEKSITRRDGLKTRALAFARPERQLGECGCPEPEVNLVVQ